MLDALDFYNKSLVAENLDNLFCIVFFHNGYILAICTSVNANNNCVFAICLTFFDYFICNQFVDGWILAFFIFCIKLLPFALDSDGMPVVSNVCAKSLCYLYCFIVRSVKGRGEM